MAVSMKGRSFVSISDLSVEEIWQVWDLAVELKRKVKAGQPFLLVVTNKDAKPAEVESKDLRFEKVVAPGKTISIRVRALKPGTYVFLDDYNKSTRGKIVAE